MPCCREPPQYGDRLVSGGAVQQQSDKIRLILQLAKPALAMLAIIDFSWHWNDYENALVFLIGHRFIIQGISSSAVKG